MSLPLRRRRFATFAQVVAARKAAGLDPIVILGRPVPEPRSNVTLTDAEALRLAELCVADVWLDAQRDARLDAERNSA